MQNVVLQAEALRALQILDRSKVAVSWVNGKAEFRSSAAPPAHVIALLDSYEPAIVELLRPNGDGRSALDLARERHQPLLRAIEAGRPPDVSDAQWETALDGLRVFLLAGHGAKAEALGWPRDELYAVPPVWSRVDLCGAGLLIGDSEVTEITSTRIGIRTASGAPQGFYRKPAPDYGLAYRERIKLAGEDGRKEEVQLRALEAVISLYRSHHPSADVDAAKAAVLAAIVRSAAR